MPGSFWNCIVANFKVYNRISFLIVDTYTYVLTLSAHMWAMCPGFPHNEQRCRIQLNWLYAGGQCHLPCLGVCCLASSCCSSRVWVPYKFMYYLPSSRGCFGHPLASHTLLDVHMWKTSLNTWSINLINDVWKLVK